MKLSQATEYAVFGLVALEKPGIHTVPVIAERLKISQIFLSKIFQKLKKKGLLSSQQGKGGGFSLPHALDQITLLSVIEAIEGPISVRKCITNSKACSGRLGKPDCCKLKTALGDAQQGMIQALEQTKLSTLV